MWLLVLRACSANNSVGHETLGKARAITVSAERLYGRTVKYVPELFQELSVSRKHLTISAVRENVNEDVRALRIVDQRSTCGTFVSAERGAERLRKLAPFEPACVVNGDMIKLGDAVRYECKTANVVVCVSSKDAAVKENLRKCAERIGVSVVAKVDCGSRLPTHLLSDGAISEKLLRALLIGCEIVTFDWLEHLAGGGLVEDSDLGAARYAAPAPDVSLSFPFLTDVDVPSLHSTTSRASLFSKYTFIFIAANDESVVMKRRRAVYKSMIELGGGEAFYDYEPDLIKTIGRDREILAVADVCASNPVQSTQNHHSQMTEDSSPPIYASVPLRKLLRGKQAHETNFNRIAAAILCNNPSCLADKVIAFPPRTQEMSIEDSDASESEAETIPENANHAELREELVVSGHGSTDKSPPTNVISDVPHCMEQGDSKNDGDDDDMDVDNSAGVHQDCCKDGWLPAARSFKTEQANHGRIILAPLVKKKRPRKSGEDEVSRASSSSSLKDFKRFKKNVCSALS